MVDYGSLEDVILLAAIHTESGKEISYDELRSIAGSIPVVTKYDGIRDFDQLAATEKENSEALSCPFSVDSDSRSSSLSMFAY
ncbi:MAG TPA: hypothetical protein VIG47_12075, partial [Gemmatimonadaceae bacterium]